MKARSVHVQHNKRYPHISRPHHRLEDLLAFHHQKYEWLVGFVVGAISNTWEEKMKVRY